MPIRNYSVLKGDPMEGKLVFGKSPHYQIQVATQENEIITVEVNVQSVDQSEVLYVIDHAFQAPDPAGLEALPVGLTKLEAKAGGLALDYVRSRVNGAPMVSRDEMTLLPPSVPAGSQQNDLNNAVVNVLNQAIADKDGAIYAFGSSYADSDGTQGIHDIHMNQGNPKNNFGSDNGVWQDGAVFVSLPASNTWIAIFIAFQTESWDTDDTTGNPA